MVERAELHHLQRYINTDAISELYFLQYDLSVDIDTGNIIVPANTAEEFCDLIGRYQRIFQKPHGLPPTRVQDHRILLVNGTGPIKVRPYRYPFVQKDAIEKLVEELLHDGFIRPSTSLFSAPVILAKKRTVPGDFVLITVPSMQ